MAEQHAASAAAGEAGGELTLRVYGIDSAERYGAVVSYLNRLSVVRSADPIGVTPEFVDLRLESSAGATGLTRLFQLEGLLAPRVDESQQNGAHNGQKAGQEIGQEIDQEIGEPSLQENAVDAGVDAVFEVHDRVPN